MGPSIVPKVAIAPVFTALSPARERSHGRDRPRAEKLHHVACGEQRGHTIAQYRVDAAQRLRTAIQ